MKDAAMPNVVQCPQCGFQDDTAKADVQVCDHCDHRWQSDAAPLATEPHWDILSEVSTSAECFFPARGSALITVLGGVLLLAATVARLLDGETTVWVLLIGGLSCAGLAVGVSRLLTRRPNVVVNERGLFTQTARIPFSSILSVTSQFRGVPVRRYLVVNADGLGTVHIELSDLHLPAARAAAAIESRLREARPELVLSESPNR